MSSFFTPHERSAFTDTQYQAEAQSMCDAWTDDGIDFWARATCIVDDPTDAAESCSTLMTPAGASRACASYNADRTRQSKLASGVVRQVIFDPRSSSVSAVKPPPPDPPPPPPPPGVTRGC